MRQRLYHCVGLPILLVILSAASTPAQHAGDDLESLRRQIAELTQSLKKIETAFNEAAAKRRAEWELNLKKLEKEHYDAFGKRHAEFAQKIEALQKREQSLLLKAEAKKKGFYVKVEIKGRLEMRPERHSFFEADPIKWWEVIAGDVHYVLNFDKNAALLKQAESNRSKTVQIKGVAVHNHTLLVQSLEAIKD